MIATADLEDRSGQWHKSLSEGDSVHLLVSLAMAINWGEPSTYFSHVTPQEVHDTTIRHWRNLQEGLRAMAERLHIDGISPWSHL